MSSETDQRVVILSINDFLSRLEPFVPRFGGPSAAGGALGGLARLAATINGERKQSPDPVLAVVAGIDPAAPWFEAFEGRAEMEGLKLAGVEAAAPGFHEFDLGPEMGRRFLSQAAFPVLCANLEGRGGFLKDLLSPCTVIVKNNVKIGVFGLCAVNPLHVFKDGPALTEIASCSETAARMVDALRAEGCQIILALTHIGLEADKKLAESVQGIHAIVGAHSHTVTPAPVFVETLGGWQTVVVQAGTGGTAIGRLAVAVTDGRLDASRTTWRLLPMDDRVASDPVVAAFVANLKAEFETQSARPVGRLAGNWDTGTEALTSGESAVGNFIADAFRAALDMDIGVAESSGIGDTGMLPPGPFTRADLGALLPFGEPLIACRLTGAQVRRLFGVPAAGLAVGEELPGASASASRKPLLHVSGLRVIYEKGDDGNVATTVLTGREGAAPLSDDTVYRLAAPAFLLMNPAYRTVVNSGSWYNSGVSETAAFVDHVARCNGLIRPALDGRLTIRNIGGKA